MSYRLKEREPNEKGFDSVNIAVQVTRKDGTKYIIYCPTIGQARTILFNTPNSEIIGNYINVQ